MRIIYSSEAEIIRIGEGVCSCTLPRAEWTHAAHFAAALWLMRYRPELEPSREMPKLIRAYNESVGRVNDDSGGYHETITQASLRAARSFLQQDPARALFATCNALMASPLGKSAWLLDYWTRARLFSVEARRRWVDPDLKALPF